MSLGNSDPPYRGADMYIKYVNAQSHLTVVQNYDVRHPSRSCYFRISNIPNIKPNNSTVRMTEKLVEMGASLGVVPSRPWLKITMSIAKSHRIASEHDVN
ncbi:hypothetical protein TNCV_1585651 [Trichonephila clavipes]|nr:hypothetical protein TNCV_1585651 [Trichonephila clavipes]